MPNVKRYKLCENIKYEGGVKEYNLLYATKVKFFSLNYIVINLRCFV